MLQEVKDIVRPSMLQAAWRNVLAGFAVALAMIPVPGTPVMFKGKFTGLWKI